MRADDVAARRSGRNTLLQALVAMGTGRPLPTPAAALAATGGIVSARVRRLLIPRAGPAARATGSRCRPCSSPSPPCPALLPVLS